MFDAISSVDTFTLPPDSHGAVRAFSRIGYELPVALADLIDNSLDARASKVEITFFRDDREVKAVILADNGGGMDLDGLRQAMQFAALTKHKPTDIGTFGLGMKSASLSQCRSLTVISKRRGVLSACRWTVEAIEAGWQCEVLESRAAAEVFNAGYASMTPIENGTVVLWERLDRLGTAKSKGDLDEFLAGIMAQLELQLGLVFHRFIGKSFAIILKSKHESQRLAVPRNVRAYDPFGYRDTGRRGYPKVFQTELPGAGQIELTAHIWPADAVSPEYLLGRRRATPHQGLYFYRNKRLIQAGGWNEFVPDVSDPELSLARVAIDLPAVGAVTNVQKSAIQVTAALKQALAQARSENLGLADYLEDARRTFRARRPAKQAAGNAPIILGAGIPAQARRDVHKLICKGGLAREIELTWASLPKNQVFEIDPAEERVLLNRKFRQTILGKSNASGVDAAVVKTLLFLLLEEEFDRSRVSAKRRDWLTRCNAILLATIKSL